MSYLRALFAVLRPLLWQEKTTLILLTFVAFSLRFVGLDNVPPGWRDDELINTLVISQKVLDGDLALYYPDASGHEALYHALNAVFLALFGPGVPGIRWLSAALGTLAVPLTYLVGRRLFGPAVGWTAAAALTFSFWSLMYSRIGLRHIALPLWTLAAFYFFWRAQSSQPSRPSRFTLSPLLLTAFFMALGFYTYFAGRGVPLVLLAFMGYVAMVAPDVWRRQWRGWGVMLALTSLLALPLAITLGQQPEAEGRVAELAVPVTAARQGDFAPLLEHVVVTLNMFHSDGDGEWLYNIPQRPLFSPIGAAFFWLGVALATYQAGWPVLRIAYDGLRRRPSPVAPSPTALPAAFLLLWWLAGISPAFLSVPPASLGHTILAQPATYLLAALPLGWLGQMTFTGWKGSDRRTYLVLLAALLVGSVALRDTRDYFVTWPQRGMTRFLYRADIRELATFLNELHAQPTAGQPPLTDFGISGLLAGPWDKLALQVDLDEATAVSPRWYNPERAILLRPALTFHGWPNVPEAYAGAYAPGDVAVGEFRLSRVAQTVDRDETVCFVNGLCLVTAVYHPDTHMLELGWWVKSPLVLPAMPLISNPPPPGVYSGPRLAAFGQLWDSEGNFLAGDDGLWVDPYTLQVDDLFLQQHWPQVAPGVEVWTAVFGLYDPMTGARILTEDGRDDLRLTIDDLRDDFFSRITHHVSLCYRKRNILPLP